MYFVSHLLGSEGKAVPSAACVLYSPPVRFNFSAALYSLLLSSPCLFSSSLPVFARSCYRCISSSFPFSFNVCLHTWPPFQPQTVVVWPSQPSHRLTKWPFWLFKLATFFYKLCIISPGIIMVDMPSAGVCLPESTCLQP